RLVSRVGSISSPWQWLLDHAPPAGRRVLMTALHEKLALVPSHPQIDDLRSDLAAAIEQSGLYHGDEIEPTRLTKRIGVHDLDGAEIALLKLVPRRVGRKGLLDQEKIDWYVKARLKEKSRVMNADFELIDRNLENLRARAAFIANALPEFHVVKLRPDSIPDPEVRAAAATAAAAINDGSSAADGGELNATELQAAIAALSPEGDPKVRKALLNTYNAMRNVRVDGVHEAAAIEALRCNLSVVLDFMTSEHNNLLQSGYAAIEIGDWSRPLRRPQSKVAQFFALPNQKGELDYQVRDLEEAKAIHEAVKDDLRQTELNAITFLFENRMWVAVYPWGDLESIQPLRTELPLFDVDSSDPAKLDYRNRGTGRVIGKVDPLYSSPGEAVYRTASRFISTIV
ncbi:MAG: hypothetical protein AAF658_20760, partial [Myxococcota bacterium]